MFIDKFLFILMDVYHIVNNSFIKKNPIPRYTHSWGVFSHNKLENDLKIYEILESLSEYKDCVPERFRAGLEGLSVFYRQIRHFEETIQRFKGLPDENYVAEFFRAIPREPLALALDFLQDPRKYDDPELSFVKMCHEMQRMGISVPLGVGQSIDVNGNGTGTMRKYQLILTDGGLSLPHKSHYDDPKIVGHSGSGSPEDCGADSTTDKQFPLLNKIVQKYLSHYFAQHLCGAKTIISLEKKIAGIALSPAEKNDPSVTNNTFSLAELQEKYPTVPWKEISEIMLCRSRENIAVESPEYVVKLFDIIRNSDARDVACYYLWRVVYNFAPYFQDRDFEHLYSRHLLGLKEKIPPKLAHVGACCAYYGGLLCFLYQKAFCGPLADQCRDAVGDLVNGIRESLRARVLKNIDWMCTETRALFLEKLDAMGVKIGGQNWMSLRNQDLDGRVPPVKLGTDGGAGYLDSVLALDKHSYAHMVHLHTKEVDRTDWFMYSFDVNAYYSAELNEIVFPWGILVRPFFSLKYPLVKNLARLGSIIGHEIIHGFDNHGSRYDKDGNFRKWWLPQDELRFTKKIQKVVEYYDKLTLNGTPLDGVLTCPENVADITGLRLSFDFLMRTSPTLYDIQTFFVYYARTQCSYHSPEYFDIKIKMDSHSPAEIRVNVPLMLFGEFYKAFGHRKSDFVEDVDIEVY